jgi:vacuolar-type H+-ATPase subunit H
MSEPQEFINPLAALRVLEVSISGVRELVAELDERHNLRFTDLQHQLETRFAQLVVMSNERLESLKDSNAAAGTSIAQRFIDSDKAIQAALTAADKAVQAALLAAKEAVAKAEMAAEKRFDAVNEFRGQLADQAQTFMPRAEAEIRLSNISDLVAANSTAIATSGGGTAKSERITSVIISIAAVATSVVAIIVVILLH